MLKKSWTAFLQPQAKGYNTHPFLITPCENGKQYRIIPCYWQGTNNPGFGVYGHYINAPKGRHTRADLELWVSFNLCATNYKQERA